MVSLVSDSEPPSTAHPRGSTEPVLPGANLDLVDGMDESAADEGASAGPQDDATSARLKKRQQAPRRVPASIQAVSNINSSISGGSSNSNSPENDVVMTPTEAQPALDSDQETAIALGADLDEDQLKRILACKRLSEGCNRFSAANFVCRKNSLIMIGESLPPVTEGEPMGHLSHQASQNIESASSSTSVSSGSLRSGGARFAPTAGSGLMLKRNSQDENTTSCSSSASLDGPKSPGGTNRRRSSTVSQCSSVLSEGTRQQLNFDLSPDLAPDSSILEANAISPIDFDRPASPEPSSLGSNDGSFDLRPVSRLSQFCDDVMLTASPDSMLTGGSNENSNSISNADSAGVSAGLSASPAAPRSQSPIDHLSLNLNLNHHHSQQRAQTDGGEPRQQWSSAIASESSGPGAPSCERPEANLTRDNLGHAISQAGAVRVSQQSEQQRQSDSFVSQKRAHTPFGASLQRNKTSMISSSPSPTPLEVGNAER